MKRQERRREERRGEERRGEGGGREDPGSEEKIISKVKTRKRKREHDVRPEQMRNNKGKK